MNYIVLMGVLVVGAGIGFFISSFICRRTFNELVKKNLELEDNLEWAEDCLDKAHKEIENLLGRRDRAIAALTPKAASIGRKMARILRGEE